MTIFNHISQVYFLGIGGIGMSALARWFRHDGYQVSGYDRAETALTKELITEGIPVHYEDLADGIGAFCDPTTTLVVYTPAVPADMGERRFFAQHGFTMKKRSEVLGMICERFTTCAVAGTHGKTTVSTMLAHILKTSTLDCTAFLGGISKNYNSNLLLSSSSKWMVAEADEFDRSFLRLFPDLAVITAMDADHLDVYGDHESVVEAFNDFTAQVKPGGKLVVKKGLPVRQGRNRDIDWYSYSLNGPADFYVEGLLPDGEAYRFNLVYPGGKIEDVRLNYPGKLNVENAVAASSLALLAGVDGGSVKEALAAYQGVKRRFDIQYRSEEYLLIDDYAHHPEELNATIRSVRSMFAGKWITGIFQPHLYSRTRDFAAEFAAQLDGLDEVILLDIYPAREEPLPGVTSALILDQMKNENSRVVKKGNLLEAARGLKPGIIVMMGAGDIEDLVE
ncbi:MAG: UDP-N-acetylmuramate--L-alanine ligase, partial [Mangrovibacterium sp.]|nr:UDP-N-acetylmuramate--L-alanine ligase [Mangrovibacterium sp.]